MLKFDPRFLALPLLALVFAVFVSCGDDGVNQYLGGNGNHNTGTRLTYADGTPIEGGTWWIESNQINRLAIIIGPTPTPEAEPTPLEKDFSDFFTGFTCADVPESETDVVDKGCVGPTGYTCLVDFCTDFSPHSTQSIRIIVMDETGNIGTAEVFCRDLGDAQGSGEIPEVETDIPNPTSPSPTPTPSF